MRVETGIWPIFQPIKTIWNTVAPVATDILSKVKILSGPIMDVNTLISSLTQEQRSGAVIQVPQEASQNISSQITNILKQQQDAIAKIQQELLVKEQQIQQSNQQAASQEQLRQTLANYGPFVIAGGITVVTLLLFILLRRRR